MAKKEGKELTPMMKQFFDLKAKHPDAVMLFRCGDFYETYCEDAVTAAKILGITLTHRNNGAGVKGDEMAGFPHHALDTYLPKLIRAGKRVAICDQLEDPKLTKKLVKRGITELVTPGVALSDNVLNYKENNFLAAVHFGKASFGVAFLDISTGEFLTGEGTQDYVEKLLGNFSPKEILYDRTKFWYKILYIPTRRLGIYGADFKAEVAAPLQCEEPEGFWRRSSPFGGYCSWSYPAVSRTDSAHSDRSYHKYFAH